MKLLIYRLYTTLLMLAVALTAAAQPYCSVRNFNLRDGLGANTISGICQDKEQLMWFSTWNGLCCYDGYRFTTFRGQSGADEVLSTNRLRSSNPDDNGNIWCISYDSRPYLFSTRQCRFVDISRIIDERYSTHFRAQRFNVQPNGYTWIVGKDGVHVRIKNAPNADGSYETRMTGHDMPPLIGQQLRKVCTDAYGREWISTDKGTQLDKHGMVSRDRLEHMKNAAGRTYLASPNGHLYWASATSNTLHRIALPTAIHAIHTMRMVTGNLMACPTNAGVLFITANTGTVRLVSVQTPAQPIANVDRIFVDSQKRVWAFSSPYGATIIDSKTLATTWIHVADTPTDYRGTRCTEPLWVEDLHGTVWLAPAGGYFGYYDAAARHIRPYAITTTGGSDYTIPEIHKWFADKQKNLWVSSSHDITLIHPSKRRFNAIQLENAVEARSVCSDAQGNRYVGFASGVVVITDNRGGRIGYLTPSGTLSATLATLQGKVYCLYFDRHKRLWIGTKGGGLYLRQTDGTMRHFTPDAADKYSINCNDIYCVDQDNRGNIWVGTYGEGLNLVQELADGTVRFLNQANALPPVEKDKYVNVRRITHTADGTVILSTTDGLVTFSNKFKTPAAIRYYRTTHRLRDSTSPTTADVMQTLVTRSGDIYITTLSGGIQKLQSPTPLADHLKFGDVQSHHTASDEGIIHSLIEDRRGTIWAVHETSIDSYNPTTGQSTLYGPNDLRDRNEFSEALATLTPNGEIMAATMGGYVCFDPRKITKSHFKPNIIFSSVQYQGDNEPQPILNSGTLNLDAQQRNFTLYFAALDYADNGMVRYAYRVEGTDQDWTYLSNGQHSVAFSHFPAGRHVIHVKSTNSDGVWMSNEKTLTINAEPTFWETIWAKLLIIAAAIAAVYAYLHYATIRRRAAMEHEMNVVKTNFFTEIGHKLRTPLTLIGGPVSQMIEKGTLSPEERTQMEMVQRNSRNMLELVNEMLEHNTAENYIVDDDNVPVFGTPVDGSATNASASNDTAADNSAAPSTPTRLLVVEDNADLRAFLASILCDSYTVLQAENGQQGLDKAIKEMPDFIITDVMMPVMDGLTMVHLIKQNRDICHIPIIVLSAKASLDDRLQGLSEGIDDYITKPFSATYLRHRIENIIAQRRMLQQNFLDTVDTHAAAPADNADAQATPEEYRLKTVQIVDADKEMMDQLMAFLEDNISNPNLRIEELAAAVHLGRSVFYEKIKSIVGMSPLDFLRHIRMQRAQELVAKSTDTFSQIAYAVGFADPKYFGKCFKKETGMTPSEYREKARNPHCI